jgi:catechol 2,3-dioxygenase
MPKDRSCRCRWRRRGWRGDLHVGGRFPFLLFLSRNCSASVVVIFDGANRAAEYTRVSRSIDPRVRIGHVHLKVADLERAIGFYRDILGFELTQRYGSSAAFLSAGGYHHHIGLNTWESAGGAAPPPGTTGLYHLAILYPTRAELADAVRRVLDAGMELDGASDHGVSDAVYLRDPDGNGVELYCDNPQDQWPRTAAGELAMHTRPLNLAELLATPPG